jgi:hypothetical protein
LSVEICHNFHHLLSSVFVFSSTILYFDNALYATKTTNTIFLAIVLVAGTIAAISPSFIIKGVNTQAEPEGPISQQGEQGFNGTQGP